MESTVQSRRRSPNQARQRRRFAAALLLMLVLSSLVSACSGGGDADPKEVLAKAIPAMKALETFSFTYEVERPENAQPVQGLDVSALQGAVNAEGNMKAAIDVLQSGIPLHLEFVAAGDTHYVQNPLSGKWQSVPAKDSPVGKLNLGAGAITILEKIKEPSSEGKEDVDGVSCYRVKGTIAATDVEGIAQAVSVETDLPVEVWVGVEDSLIRRITLSGAATKTEDPKTTRTIELTKFNEPVQIEPPA